MRMGPTADMYDGLFQVFFFLLDFEIRGFLTSLSAGCALY